jgi:hypothetical protein
MNPTAAAASAGSGGPGTPAARAFEVNSQSDAPAVGLRQLFGASLLRIAPGPVPVATAADTPFIPAFRTATGSDGTVSWKLNSNYFATKETAQWIANKYGTGEVIETPFGGVGGIFSASALEYHIKLPDGRDVNAGILAGYYERNPPDKFPGLAEKLIKIQLGLA